MKVKEVTYLDLQQMKIQLQLQVLAFTEPQALAFRNHA